MVSTYSDIAIRPDIAGYPLVNKQTSDDKDAADFERILRNPALAPARRAADSAAPTHKHVSFMEFLKGVVDVINPLQHIPVVSAIYRHITGDEISPMARFAGDALYGGPIGGALAAGDIAYQKMTGKDVGETVIASLTSGGKKDAPTATPETMLAEKLDRDVAPAAGDDARAHQKITWSDDTNVQTASSPLFPHAQATGTIGEGTASPSTSAQPPLQPKNVASTSILQAQEAPAGMDRTSMPPGLIASKMMEALDKYAEMKGASLAGDMPNASSLY